MTTRRQGPQRYGDLSDLNISQECELFHGTALIDAFRFSDENEMFSAWQQNRESLRRVWADNHAPGTRCFAEWLFEIIPKFGERRLTTFGEKIRRECYLKHGILHTHGYKPLQEDEHIYLFRNGVIDSWEFSQAEEIERAEKEHLQRWFDWIHRKQVDGTSP